MRIVRSLLAVGIVLFLSLPLPASSSRIVSIEIVSDEHQEEIRKVLPIREGDPYDAVKMDQAISYLRKWGRFDGIDVTKETTAGGIRLRFVLRQGNAVSGIDIYGTYPYLSTRIRRLITIHSGDLYDAALAEEQTEKIIAFYERQGYAETTVRFTPRFNEAKKTVDLRYHIKKGNRYRIGKITIEGNTVFPRGYFVSKIDPLIAYTNSRLRKSLEKIRKDYQDKGYLGARVRLTDLGKDDAAKEVNPVIEIKEGKHITVIFEGNQRVSRRTFKKTLPLFTEGGYSFYEIDASSKAIIDQYHRLGFQEVTVSRGEKQSVVEDNEVQIQFIIQEGPQIRVKTIEIEGNHEISDRKIKKQLITRGNSLSECAFYQPRTVDQDFTRLPDIMKNRGALEAEALDHETSLNTFHDKAHVSFTVREGEITRIREIRFEGNHQFTGKKLENQLGLSMGDPVSMEKINLDKEALTLFYANNGFPYASVTADLDRNGSETALIFKISEGIPVTIGEVLVVGNERTDKKAVLRAMRIRPGKPFSYKRVLESESELRRSGAFRSVNIQTIGLAEKDTAVHLVVKLEEYRKILLDVGITYDTDNFFTGDLSISHINLGGTIRRGNLKLTGGRDIQKGELLFKDPFFIGYPFEASASVFLERDLKPGFKITEGGGSLNFLREFSSRMSVLARYQAIRTFLTDVTDVTGAAERDHTTSKFSFSFNYDRRDSYSDPQKGYVAFAGVDYSNKLIASSFNFLQPKGYFAYYLPLGSRTTLITFVRMEGIKVFGGDQLPRDKKLFLGGDYTVRGFDEDSVGPIGTDGRPAGGQLLISSSSEIQTRLFRNFKLALFLDSGSLTNDFGTVSTASFRHSAGAGLRYVTPIGPLRLDYGFKLDKRVGESVGRLHLAFGYSF